MTMLYVLFAQWPLRNADKKVWGIVLLTDYISQNQEMNELNSGIFMNN